MSAPDNDNMAKSLKDLKQHNVKKLVRLCECTYDEQEFKDNKIEVYDLSFADG
jgi:protein tyrosine phosphatase type 4A